MAQLPIFKDDNQSLMLMQTKWKSILDPVIAGQLTAGNFIQNVSIVPGTNVINHLLGRQQQGWFLTDQTAVPYIYRSQPFNSTTLTLSSSTSLTISLWVF